MDPPCQIGWRAKRNSSPQLGGRLAGSNFRGLIVVVVALAVGPDPGIAREIFVSSVGRDGTGRGTATSPYVVRSKDRMDRVMQQAPEGSTVRFRAGTYPTSVRISKSLTLVGAGNETILQSDTIGEHVVQFGGKGCSLTLRNLTMQYTGGWADASAATDGLRMVAEAESVVAENVVFRDFYNAVHICKAILTLRVNGCSFLYRHGRAGVSSMPPYQHPAVAVLGCGLKSTIVRDCYFNGLMDKTFRGLKGNPPEDQKTPMDGLYKTGGGNPEYTLIENNVVRNHGIEGILCERIDESGSYRTIVRGNATFAANYKSSFYGVTCPGIVIWHVQNAEVTGNAIHNAPRGISVRFKGASPVNACEIRGNVISRALIGAEIFGGGNKTIFEHNHVFCSSEPAKSVFPVSVEWCGLIGVSASGTPIIRNNRLTASRPAWDAQPKLLERADNVLTVSSTKDIRANQGVLMAIRPDGLTYFPVRNVHGNKVTVSAQWTQGRSAGPGDTLVYARQLGNFTSLAGVCSFARSSNALVQNNFISGFVQDVATSNWGGVRTQCNTVQNVGFIPKASQYIQRLP